MQTALIRTVLTNAHVKLDTLAMDTHVQVQLIFLTQDDHECISPFECILAAKEFLTKFRPDFGHFQLNNKNVIMNIW